MARKVFISVLGYSNYSECYYIDKNKNFKSGLVRYVQEATLQYLSQDNTWSKSDIAYILLTEGAEQRNWVDNGQVEYGTNISIIQTGLESQLKKLHLLFPVIPVNIPEGNNEKEIWTIFERIFELIQDDDELYFDLTHGFRYLPMLILVLGNYTKFLKNITIKSITYGNYEARNRDTNEAPFINLMTLSNLQDWTSASASFIKSGNITMLKNVSNTALTPILREAQGTNFAATTLKKYINILEKVVDDMNTCRGTNILEGENISKLLSLSDQLKDTDIIIEPLKPIINKIKNSFRDFIPSSNIKNGYLSAKWCFDNSLYQQALTILHETIVSHICEKENFNIDNKEKREIVNKAFKIHRDRLKEEEWTVENDKEKELIKQVLQNKLLEDLSHIFKITTGLRNDFNHAGMNKNPAKKERLIKNLEDCINTVINLSL